MTSRLARAGVQPRRPATSPRVPRSRASPYCGLGAILSAQTGGVRPSPAVGIGRARYDSRNNADANSIPLSVSNSLSGRHWELDQVPAVGHLTDIVQLGTGHHVSAGEGQRRVALQRRMAAHLVVVAQTPDATQRGLNPGFSERIRNSRRTG